ncbi:MAG: hypothetical protein IPK66_06105 [Rhodospirillales bacterium]|nr:hypothetical protein [Rhodospirillales bacterium]
MRGIGEYPFFLVLAHFRPKDRKYLSVELPMSMPYFLHVFYMLAFLFLSLLAFCARGPRSDGDSPKIDSERVRLWEIDAPETGATLRMEQPAL